MGNKLTKSGVKSSKHGANTPITVATGSEGTGNTAASPPSTISPNKSSPDNNTPPTRKAQQNHQPPNTGVPAHNNKPIVQLFTPPGRQRAHSASPRRLASPVDDNVFGHASDRPQRPIRSSLSNQRSEQSRSIISRSKFISEHAGVLTSHYKLDVKKLGQGTYGSVNKGLSISTGQSRAIKSISKAQVKNIDRFRQEISIMKHIDHPNIIRLYETFEDHRNIYLVMELCTGGELFDRIIEEGHFSERGAATLMKQIFSAVHYLHSNFIMHRDLKPENFLFLNKSPDSPLKIIDFGLSCRFNSTTVASTKAGTPYYVAPEVLHGKYDKACDDWSCGVIMYVLLCGYPPFYGDTDAEVLAKVRKAEYSFSGAEWKKVSDSAKDLIQKLLQKNADKRLTVGEALKHSWLNTHAVDPTSIALPDTLMTNLKGFRAQNRLKKAALTVIATHTSEKDIENLKQIFINLDVDHSGTLSVQELTEGLKRLGWKEIPPDLQQIIQEVDSDGSGYVDYTEFLAATMDKRLYIKEDICWAAFRVFDLDGNGKISAEELRRVLGMPNVEVTVGKETIQALLDDVDLNGDGEIDFDEFMHMMKRRNPIGDNAN